MGKTVDKINTLDLGKHTRTAGAYLLYDDTFLFMAGIGICHRENELGVVRFGGHREAGESPEQCAVREVMEETSLALELYGSPVTYIMQGTDVNCMRKIDCTERCRPVFISENEYGQLSVM